jgi:hypothetical protein
MGQRPLTQSTSAWFLIASDGDMVVRVSPGMSIGETATGELSFDSACARVELEIAEDGGLVLRAVGEHELEPAGGTRRRRERLPRKGRAQIRLGHHVMQLATDFASRAAHDEVVTIRLVRPGEERPEPALRQSAEPPAADPAVPLRAARPPLRSTSRSTRSKRRSPGGIPLPEPAPPVAQAEPGVPEPELGATEPEYRIPEPRRAPQPGSRPPQDDARTAQTRSHQPTPPRRRRVLVPSVAALIGLAVGIGFTLLYHSALRDDEPARPDGPAATPTAAEPATVPPIEPVVVPPMARRATPPRPRADGSDGSAPAVVAADTAAADTAAAEVEAGDPRAGDPRAAVAQAAEPEAAIAEAAVAEAAVAEALDLAPDPRVVAELERIGATALALAAELTGRRDLLAADLALAQGQLTTPAEASAYALYSRVLALDPASEDARSGLQSVRQALINRALAQLASGALEQARRSLEAAADAGADPRLIADLQREVDYRQQRLDTSSLAPR